MDQTRPLLPPPRTLGDLLRDLAHAERKCHALANKNDRAFVRFEQKVQQMAQGWKETI